MRAPKLPSIFKSQRNKQFSIPSRYYDPRKERIEELENRYANKEEEASTEYNSPKKLNFRDATTHQAFGKSRGDRMSNIRIVAIIIALSALAYYLIYHF